MLVFILYVTLILKFIIICDSFHALYTRRSTLRTLRLKNPNKVSSKANNYRKKNNNSNNNNNNNNSGRRRTENNPFYDNDNSKISSSSTSSSSTSKNVVEDKGIRLNKCIPSLSRRGADAAISEGRVCVNGHVVLSAGTRVLKGDLVELDGKKMHWSNLNKAKTKTIATNRDHRKLVYLKYWKPRGVTSTSDLNDDSNIIHAGRFELFPQRLFTVGRLDKESTGLILLTSDGRLNNAMLDPKENKEKHYEVLLDKDISNEDIKRLCDGVVISTPVQRKGNKLLTAKTKPCRVTRIGSSSSSSSSGSSSGSGNGLTFILTEGRNRQIRRMVESLGYQVVSLHRTKFADIDIKGLSSNEWAELDEKEIRSITNILNRNEKNLKN